MTDVIQQSSDTPRRTPVGGGLFYYRHRLPVRIMHWVNVLAATVLLMSGLQIFNAHPNLYWGQSSYASKPAVLSIGSETQSDGRRVGTTKSLGRQFDTTGVLGVSSENGELSARAFPAWSTIPGTQWLAMARRWHLFFTWVLVINGLAYVIYSIGSHHLARDLAPTHVELRSIPKSIGEHLRFQRARGEAAKHYNVVQKLAYVSVIYGLLPVIILAGLAMSPWLDTLIPGWVNVLGGRQSARTIHFIAAWLLVGFVAVHVFEVVVSGFWNNVRSMITGRYRVSPVVQHESTR